MSPASLGGGNKLFTREIQQDLVKLILHDLETLRKKLFSKRVEGEMQSTNTAIQREMYQMQRISTKIQRKVKVMTEFLTAIDEWENQVLNCFLKIKWFFQKYQNEDEFLSTIDENNNNLQVVLNDIEELEHEVPELDKILSNEPSPNTIFEVGGSSNSNVKETGTEKDDLFVEVTEKLNTQQRDCLQSLAIFPENAELKKKLLINWWVGLGILPSEGDASAMENQSTEIFSQLEDNCILKPKKNKKHNRATDSYTINSTILKHLIFDFKGKGRIVSEDMKKEDPLHFYKDDKDNVAAVLNLNQKHLTDSKYISGPAIKVALLGKWHHTDIDVHDDNKENKETIYYGGGTKFLQKMGETMTYLSLRGISNIEELPQSFGMIRSLKILDLKDCHSLQKLPKKPKSLCSDDFWFKELMHLDITGCYLLDHMPKWVFELSNLQVLKGGMFNCFLNITDQCRLKDIRKLQKLVKLSIKVIYPEFLSHDDCTGLESLSNLLVLTIVWNFHERETKKQRKDNVKDSTNISGEGDDQIPGVIEDQVIIREKESRENARGKASNFFFSRFRGKRQEVNNDKMVEKKKQSRNNSGVNEDGRKIPTILFPKNLEKLDIRCYPNVEAPELSNAAKLKSLKRLYIRGGKLANIEKDGDWQVEILRLRFLKFLDLDWYELGDIFPKLRCVEYEKCPRVKFFTRDSGYWNKEINGSFLSHTGPFDDDDEPLPPQNPIQHEIEEPVVVPSIETLSHDIYNMEALLKLSSTETLNLVMVLDITRSMGHEELAMMKTVVLSFINDLISNLSFVRLSIVTFGTHAKRQCGLLLLTESRRTKLEKLVGGFEADGTTTVSDGLEMGLKVLKNRRFGRERPTAMMVISGSNDIGNALHVPMDDVTVHTFGISSSQDYDRTALESIAARSRKGTFTHVANTDDLIEALHKCRRLLCKYEVQDLTLSIVPMENITISLQSEDGTDHRSSFVRFGNLFAGEVHTATIKVNRSDGHTLQGSPTKIFTIAYSYRLEEYKYDWECMVSNDWPNLRLYECWGSRRKS